MMTLGFADEIAAGGDALLNPLLGTGNSGGSFSERYQRNVEQQRSTDRADAQERGGYRLAGQLAGGVGGALGLARAGLLPSVNAAMSGARLPAVAGLSAGEGLVLGALQGAGGGETTEGRLSGAREGGATGLAVGAVAPVVMSGLGSLVRRAVSPQTIAPERQAAAQVLAREGVETTAGQQSGSLGLRYRESELGGSAMAGRLEKQGEQFTRAALRRAGIEADRATPDVIAAGRQRLGQNFEGIAARNAILPDQKMASELTGAVRRYFGVTGESARAPIVHQTVGDVMQAIKTGNFNSAFYSN
ncbi:MAG TPA: hypothetical protein VGE47_02305, partial [Burkholderiaceae bacterium]